MRPLLLPALRRIPRGPTTVQLGVDPEHATTLDFADPAAARLLGLLDGSRTWAQVLRDADRVGIPATEAQRVVNTLRAAGLVLDHSALLPPDLGADVRTRLAPEAGGLSLRSRPGNRTPAGVLTRRRRATVAIRGRGQLVAVIASLLGAAGVGRLEIETYGRVEQEDVAAGGLLPGDVGRLRSVAVADAVRRASPDPEVGPPRAAMPDLVILVGPPPAHPGTTVRYSLRRCPHLAVWPRDGVVVLGPLVRPGESACLDCLHLHRQSRDPHWPSVAAYLANLDAPSEPVEAVVTGVGSALAAGHALHHLDGGVPPSVGRTLEIAAPGEIRRRRWPPHPRCGCLRGPRRSAGGAASGPPGGRTP